MYWAHGKCASNMNRAWHCCILQHYTHNTHVSVERCVYLWMMPSIYNYHRNHCHWEKCHTASHQSIHNQIDFTNGVRICWHVIPIPMFSSALSSFQLSRLFLSCLLSRRFLCCVPKTFAIVLAFDIPLAAKMFDYGHFSPFTHKPGQSFYRMLCSFSPLRS